MSKVVKLFKFTPVILTLLGIFLIVGAFSRESKKIDQNPTVNSATIKPQIAGESTNTETVIGQGNKITSKVIRVVDGDTIELESGQKVRYIGINTPETVHPTKPVECFGHEASAKNKELVEGKNIELGKDVSETDKYGRLLRYVYVDGIFVNDYLVREGFANSTSFPPDIKYQGQFLKAEAEARQKNRGLWNACSNSANQSQVSNDPISTESGPNNCTIKGNISSGGKIYHMPGQYYYNKTQIDESKDEKWFCTEAEAQAAGWRKSLK